MKFTLNGDWSLSFTLPGETDKRTISAKVPGNVETALMENGLLSDCMPADDTNATAHLNQVDDWTYVCEFDAPELNDGWTRNLVFEGLDTIAEIYLNDELIYNADNMFIPHKIDVCGKIKDKNKLAVVFRSALLAVNDFDGECVGETTREHTLYAGLPHLRKARHEWGWDNAPRLLTAGIYRSVYIESLPPKRFGDVYLATAQIDDKNVKLVINWRYITDSIDMTDYRLRCTITQDGETIHSDDYELFYTRGSLVVLIPRDKIKLWWPRSCFKSGQTKADLCDVKLEMLYKGESEAEWSSRWGARTIKLDYTDDVTKDNEGEFVFIVNGEKIYINGTNWKPLDALHSKADTKVKKALDMVCDLNCNMVRIWGGGIYEDTEFFDYCDEAGLMVWQDFMFACEFPPSEDWFCDKIYEETSVIIKKLRNHPSLAVWCSDNEDDSCCEWLFGKDVLPSHNKISREVLKRCAEQHDPFRSYVPSSPYISDRAFLEEDGRTSVELHLYPATIDMAKALRECRSRFIGETGPIMVNAMTDNENIFAREKNRAERLWNEYLPKEKRKIGIHQQDVCFNSWRMCGKELCELWYGRDFDVDEWKDYSIAVNIICSDLFKDVIEYCRCSRPDKTGVIWWSLLDMWPMSFDYSVVDYDFHKKMPYYWIKQSQQHFALMGVRKELDGEVAIYAANDTLECQKGTYKITSIDQNGNKTPLAMGAYSEAPNSSRMIQRLAEKDSPELWIIEWEQDGKVCYNHFATKPKETGFEAWKLWNNILMDLYKAE